MIPPVFAETTLPGTVLDAGRWVEAFRRIVMEHRGLFGEVVGQAARTDYEGIGEGGDRSLVIDRRAEDLVIAELEKLAARGQPMHVITEERGRVELGAGPDAPTVVVDPIDGSLNARRTLPGHALSIAVASGGSMADVELGFLHDFGSGEELTAIRGGGAWSRGRRLQVPPGPGLEVVGLEAAEPGAVLALVEGLRGLAFRIRVLGSVAITLGRVATGALDGMICARPVRSVDVAAAQLLARQAGAHVSFGGPLERTPLDLDARYPLCAARTPEDLATLERLLEGA